jgi:hypothetical protein
MCLEPFQQHGIAAVSDPNPHETRVPPQMSELHEIIVLGDDDRVIG